jgi:hypothetical protein
VLLVQLAQLALHQQLRDLPVQQVQQAQALLVQQVQQVRLAQQARLVTLKARIQT